MLPLQQQKLCERPCILLISSFLDVIWGSKDEGANCEQGGHDLLVVLSRSMRLTRCSPGKGLGQEWFLKLSETPGSEWGGLRGIFSWELNCIDRQVRRVMSLLSVADAERRVPGF